MSAFLDSRWRRLLGQQSASVDKQATAGRKGRKARREKARLDEFESVKEKKGREGMSDAQEGEGKKPVNPRRLYRRGW